MERIAFNVLPNGLLTGMFQTQHFLDQSGFDRKILHLVRLRVSQINSCAYCIDMHYKEAIHDGETPLRLISLTAWRETPYYSSQEQAALVFAEKATKAAPDEHTDDIHEELDKYYSKQEIAILTLAVAQINAWNRIARSFGTTPGNFEVKEKVHSN
jgi:AhpD family alkylhydroperoxidase